MTADDGLEAILAEHSSWSEVCDVNVGWHYECSCGMTLPTNEGHTEAWEDLAAHQAAVVRAAGWRRVREEWAVKHHGYGNAAHYEPCADEEGARRRAALSVWSGYVEPKPARRYVTDWEEA